MARIRPRESVLSNLRRVLPRLLRRYFSRGTRLAKDRAPDEELHRFRIRTKCIRYTLELYSEVLPEVIGGSLKHFQRVQEQLGNLQDQRMFRAWLEARAAECPESAQQYHALVRVTASKRAEFRKGFFQQWKELAESGFEEKLLGRIRKARPAEPVAGRGPAARRQEPVAREGVKKSIEPAPVPR
jgi:CHAD domain-containing protein